MGRCKLHGGATRNQSTAARAAKVEAEARALLARMDVTPVTDPLAELNTLAGQVLAWRDTCAELVNKLTSVRYDGEFAGEHLRAEVALFERALDRCGDLLVKIARLDIDERLAAITEKQAGVIVRAVEAALSAAGVHGTAAVEARSAVARELRLVEDPGRRSTSSWP